MSRKGSKALPRPSAAAISILASGGSIVQAAAATHRSRQTVAKWLTRPDFQTAVAQAREQFLLATQGSLAALAVEGVSYLAVIWRDSEQPAAARVGAIRTLLDHAWRGREQMELSARMSRIEQTLEQGPARPVGALSAPAIREVPQ